MKLVHIPAMHADFAWRDGAHALGESCVEECTPDQLKLLISRGERNLVRMDADGKAIGWAVYVIQQLPNMRVFFVTNLAARGAGFQRFWDEVKSLAERNGCSRVRCSALPAQSRIFREKLGMKSVYETLETEL